MRQFNGQVIPTHRTVGTHVASGVARGGQQGRIGVVHGGIGGASRGGRTALASQPKPLRATGRMGYTEHAYVPPKPVLPTTGAVAPAPETPVPTGVVDPADPFGLARDATYYDDLRNAQRGYDDSVNPMLAQLKSLQDASGTASGVAGKTLYDVLYGKAQTDFGNQVRGSRDTAAQSGLLHSGAYDRTAGGLDEGWLTQQKSLSDQYGANHINDLQTQVGQQQASFTEQKRLMALSAAARMQEAQAAANEAAGGETGTAAGGVADPTGQRFKSGFHRDNKGHINFRNASGAWAYNVKAPANNHVHWI